MRVLLITPENRFIKAFRRGQFNNFVQLTMPYLAGFVRPPHRVTLVDEYNQPIDVDAPADLVGITCNTPNASHVYELADAFRRRGRLVVLGGPHATLLPDEARQHQREGRLLTKDWSYYNGKTAMAFEPARMSAKQLWEGYMWFRRRFFAPGCILERVRRSGVRRLQSIILNLGYRRTLVNRIPGQPISNALQD